MNGITVGKYVPGYSFVHKMDPRIKLIINIAFIVLVFLIKDFIVLGATVTPIIIAYLFSTLPKRQLVKMIIPVFFIGFFLLLINLFVIKSGDTPSDLFKPIVWWKITVSEKAVINTALLMIRVYAMIVATTLLISTTKPTALTHSIEDVIMPLKLIRVPVHIIAMIISIALRFIPTLLEEAQRIMKAQASRGVDFKNGNAKSKGKALITLIIPLFVSAFSKAEDLSSAMEVRGYNPYEKRTRYRTYHPGWRDLIAVAVVIGAITFFVLAREAVVVLPTW